MPAKPRVPDPRASRRKKVLHLIIGMMREGKGSRAQALGQAGEKRVAQLPRCCLQPRTQLGGAPPVSPQPSSNDRPSALAACSTNTASASLLSPELMIEMSHNQAIAQRQSGMGEQVEEHH